MDESRLVVVGLSHKTSPIEHREQAAVAPDRVPDVLDGIRRDDLIAGAVVLSTCNRVEIYASCPPSQNSYPAACENRLKSYFIERCPGAADELYVKRGHAAVRHLFRTASGLESLVVGEHQILGQVKTAYQKSCQSSHCDKLLNQLFQRALAVGKIVRAQTSIAQGITSCGGAAVALVEKILGQAGQAKVMLIGAGKMAETAAEHLLSQKTVSFIVSNRNYEKAKEIAARFNGAAMGLEEGMHMIQNMDVVIASTSCPHYLVTAERLSEIIKIRNGRGLVLIDLGVPRNIDPQVQKISGVHLYNVDSLESVVQEAIAKRQTSVDSAVLIVEEHIGDFLQMFGRLAMSAAAA